MLPNSHKKKKTLNHLSKSIETADQRSLMIRIVSSAVYGCQATERTDTKFNWSPMCVYCLFYNSIVCALCNQIYSSNIYIFHHQSTVRCCRPDIIKGKSGLKITENYRKLQKIDILYTVPENWVSHRAMSPSPACDVISEGKYWGWLMFIPLQTFSDAFIDDNIP